MLDIYKNTKYRAKIQLDAQITNNTLIIFYIGSIFI